MYCYHPHLTDEETEAESYLPKVTKLVRRTRDSDPDICSNPVPLTFMLDFLSIETVNEKLYNSIM